MTVIPQPLAEAETQMELAILHDSFYGFHLYIDFKFNLAPVLLLCNCGGWHQPRERWALPDSAQWSPTFQIFVCCDLLMGKHVETLPQVRDQDPDACPIRNRGGEAKFSRAIRDSKQKKTILHLNRENRDLFWAEALASFLSNNPDIKVQAFEKVF